MDINFGEGHYSTGYGQILQNYISYSWELHLREKRGHICSSSMVQDGNVGRENTLCFHYLLLHNKLPTKLRVLKILTNYYFSQGMG